jgi:hypothetical protein
VRGEVFWHTNPVARSFHLSVAQAGRPRPVGYFRPVLARTQSKQQLCRDRREDRSAMNNAAAVGSPVTVWGEEMRRREARSSDGVTN